MCILSILDKKNISVYNWNDFSFTVTTKDSSVLINRATSEYPGVVQLTADEIKGINNTSRTFKDGWLFFDEAEEKEIYEDLLRIPTWESILRNVDIIDIILTSDLDGLTQIINCEYSVLDRVRSVYMPLINLGQHDISNRVLGVLNTRHDEIQRGILKTRIDLTDMIIAKSKLADVNKLKLENEQLENQVKELQSQIKNVDTKINDEIKDETKPNVRAGRKTTKE